MASPTPQPLNGKQYYDSSRQNLDNPHASLHTDLTKFHDSHLVQDLTPSNISSHPYTHASEAHFAPGIASVNIAATSARPNGTTKNDWAEKHQHQTVLQQHCSYWDKDSDGVIWPLDTYRGCRAWGWNPLLCLLVVLIVNGALSYPTNTGWLPDPFFRIFLLRVHRDKHGSDSLTYDNQGRFKSQAFEEFFSNYDRGNKGGLSAADLFNAWTGQRLVFDLFGWSAFAFEWFAMYLLIWPADGIMRKEDISMSYDGSLFQKKADDYAKKQMGETYGVNGFQAKSGPPRIE